MADRWLRSDAGRRRAARDAAAPSPIGSTATTGATSARRSSSWRAVRGAPSRCPIEWLWAVGLLDAALRPGADSTHARHHATAMLAVVPAIPSTPSTWDVFAVLTAPLVLGWTRAPESVLEAVRFAAAGDHAAAIRARQDVISRTLAKLPNDP